MAQMVASIRYASQAMVEIKATHQAQNQDIAAIHAAMAPLDEMTQQNAALVEQSAAAAQSLLGQAHDLSSLIGRFMLPRQGEPASERPALAHARLQLVEAV